MSKTMAVHVRCKSLYISLPSSAKQQREMTEGSNSLFVFKAFYVRLILYTVI